MLSKPSGRLAPRTRADVRGVGARLRGAHGVPTVLYVGIAELARARVDAAGARAYGCGGC